MLLNSTNTRQIGTKQPQRRVKNAVDQRVKNPACMKKNTFGIFPGNRNMACFYVKMLQNRRKEYLICKPAEAGCSVVHLQNNPLKPDQPNNTCEGRKKVRSPKSEVRSQKNPEANGRFNFLVSGATNNQFPSNGVSLF